MDGAFPMKSSANDSYGKIPMVYNSMNQTTKIGKIPKDQNPQNSFENPLNQRSP